MVGWVAAKDEVLAWQAHLQKFPWHYSTLLGTISPFRNSSTSKKELDGTAKVYQALSSPSLGSKACSVSAGQLETSSSSRLRTRCSTGHIGCGAFNLEDQHLESLKDTS